MGEHNVDVFGRLLGIDADRRAELKRQEVI